MSLLMIVGSEYLHTELISVPGNERLQEMMGIMAEERGGKVFATDERYGDDRSHMHRRSPSLLGSASIMGS